MLALPLLLTLPTCRPMDSSKVTKETGPRVYVDNPQSILINGQASAAEKLSDSSQGLRVSGVGA